MVRIRVAAYSMRMEGKRARVCQFGFVASDENRNGRAVPVLFIADWCVGANVGIYLCAWKNGLRLCQFNFGRRDEKRLAGQVRFSAMDTLVPIVHLPRLACRWSLSCGSWIWARTRKNLIK